MSECRIELLSIEDAKKAAEAVEMTASFAELNIFRALLHRPRTAKALSDLLVSLLFGAALDDRLRELVIMRIGWATGSEYEWTQHWAIARQRFGCSDEDLLAVRDWQSSSHLGADQKLVLAATDELLQSGSLSQDTVSRCCTTLGRDATIELVTAVGAWRLVSKFTRALDIPLEAGVASWPPDAKEPPAAV